MENEEKKNHSEEPKLVSNGRIALLMFYIGMSKQEIWDKEKDMPNAEQRTLFHGVVDNYIEEEADEAALTYLFELNDGEPVARVLNAKTHEAGDDEFDSLRKEAYERIHSVIYILLHLKETDKEEADAYFRDYMKKKAEEREGKKGKRA